MPKLKHNIVANLVGSAWSALMALAFIPVYIHFLGIAAYGLIGVYFTLVALFSLLDLGISSTLNRELSRLSAGESNPAEMRDMVRTLELIYWLIAAAIGAAVMFFSGFIAYHWLHSRSLSSGVSHETILIMGMAMALQWPTSLYVGGLLGLERQVLLNGIFIGTSTLRGAGAAAVLWLVSPTIQAFFVWQIIAGVVQTGFLGAVLWRCLPRAGRRPAFQTRILRRIWRFAAGVSGITVTSLLLTQLDKVILSKLLSLEMYGYYMVADTAASGLYRLVSPVFTALYPRFSRLVALGDREALKKLYHGSCQLMSVLILPAGLVICFFSKEILLLWTQNAAIAEQSRIILILLAAGTLLNGVMNLPYALQLAYGWTRLSLYANVAAVAILAPATYLAALRFGGAGAAVMWLLLNAGYVLVIPNIMHRRILPGERWGWYLDDFAKPAAAALAVVLAGRWVVPAAGISDLQASVYLVVILLVALAASMAASPRVRERILAVKP